MATYTTGKSTQLILKRVEGLLQVLGLDFGFGADFEVDLAHPLVLVLLLGLFALG